MVISWNEQRNEICVRYTNPRGQGGFSKFSMTRRFSASPPPPPRVHLCIRTEISTIELSYLKENVCHSLLSHHYQIITIVIHFFGTDLINFDWVKDHWNNCDQELWVYHLRHYYERQCLAQCIKQFDKLIKST